jgi:hypothetical protein
VRASAEPIQRRWCLSCTPLHYLAEGVCSVARELFRDVTDPSVTVGNRQWHTLPLSIRRSAACDHTRISARLAGTRGEPLQLPRIDASGEGPLACAGAHRRQRSASERPVGARAGRGDSRSHHRRRRARRASAGASIDSATRRLGDRSGQTVAIHADAAERRAGARDP